MAYQIDQSGKIEQTNKSSYICLANGTHFLVSISAQDKQQLKNYFRVLNKPLIFKLFTFAVLCAKVIIEVKPGAVIIDQEYIGNERNIKSFIVQILKVEGQVEPIISFSQIGKNSSAHKGAYNGFVNKRSVKKVTYSEVFGYYESIIK